MNTTIFPLIKPFTTTPTQLPRTSRHRPLLPLHLSPIKSSSDNGNNTATDDVGNPSPPVPPPVNAAAIRFRRGSRKRKQLQEDGAANGLPKQAQASTPKDWESMTLSEKAMELYVGEKGLLFWLNKLAYASIFIVIGGWILFRFVGPSLNLYQLDSAPLSPTTIFKGS
ncbi:unnamed protein product [Ilex paraguariensis]|uniref:Uncharacterized protein n=1 Tax=Ilex paraguariensis TaxID=185542 RepID=A0ABC8SIK6_9AQUA